MVAVPVGTHYYAAKNLGFEATTARYVAFADSDCWPADGWLTALFEPLLRQTARVTAGRTCYREDALGISATTIDFMYFDSPLGPHGTRNFYANNVAFERSLFAALHYEAGQRFYRGDCQMMGVLLQQQGIEVRFVPEARTTHRLPDSARDFVRLRLRRGADSTRLAGRLFEQYAPKLAPLARLPRVSGVVALGARWYFSLRSINHQDMPDVNGLAKAQVVAYLSAISALDVAGAIIARRGDHPALSYHRDVDELGTVDPLSAAA